jgi:hypothetical protein
VFGAPLGFGDAEPVLPVGPRLAALINPLDLAFGFAVGAECPLERADRRRVDELDAECLAELLRTVSRLCSPNAAPPSSSR